MEGDNRIGGFVDGDEPTDTEGALQEEIEELAVNILLAAVSSGREFAARCAFALADEFIAERERRRGDGSGEL